MSLGVLYFIEIGEDDQGMYENMASLKQSNSVEEYVQDFKSAAAQLSAIFEE